MDNEVVRENIRGAYLAGVAWTKATANRLHSEYILNEGYWENFKARFCSEFSISREELESILTEGQS